MFLSYLNRKEKLKFLDLAIYMVDIDSNPTEVEKRVVKSLFAEIGEDIVNEYSHEFRSDIDTTINYFKESNQVVRNIIYFNLCRIAITDDLYNTTEHLFLERLEEEYGISREKRKQLVKCVYDERDLREKALRVIREY